MRLDGLANDDIVFAATAAYGSADYRTISTITAAGGTTATITFTALTYAHAAGAPVGNFSSNVTVDRYSTYTSYFYTFSQYTSGSFDSYLHFENARFEGIGGAGGSKAAAFNLVAANVSGSTARPFDPVNKCAFFTVAGNTGGGPQLEVYAYRQRIAVNDCAFYAATTSSSCIIEQSNSVADFARCSIYRCAGSAILSQTGQGGVNCTLTDCNIFGVTGKQFNILVAFSPVFTDCVFGPTNDSAFVGAFSNIASAKFIGCDLGSTYGKGAATYLAEWLVGYGDGTITFTDCTFASLTYRPATFVRVQPSASINIVNQDGDLTIQHSHDCNGDVSRNNAVFTRGRSSILLEPDIASTAARTLSLTFPTSSGVEAKVVVALRKNAAYGSSTRPSVTISGLGITPDVFTMSDSTDTWESHTFAVTQSSGADGNLTLTFSGQSTGAGAKCYMDGAPLLPYVSWVQHYGYTYDPANVVTDSRFSGRAERSGCGSIDRPGLRHRRTDDQFVAQPERNLRLDEVVRGQQQARTDLHQH